MNPNSFKVQKPSKRWSESSNDNILNIKHNLNLQLFRNIDFINIQFSILSKLQALSDIMFLNRFTIYFSSSNFLNPIRIAENILLHIIYIYIHTYIDIYIPAYICLHNILHTKLNIVTILIFATHIYMHTYKHKYMFCTQPPTCTNILYRRLCL